jgi:hypothetical protein
MPNRPTIQSSCAAGSIFLTARSTTEVCHYTSYGLSKSVRSPAFFPETGSSRADSGLCHFADRLATSPIIRAKPASLMSPGNGTTSRPVPQAEDARRASREILRSLHRCAGRLSSSTWQHETGVTRVLDESGLEDGGGLRRDCHVPLAPQGRFARSRHRSRYPAGVREKDRCQCTPNLFCARLRSRCSRLLWLACSTTL